MAALVIYAIPVLSREGVSMTNKILIVEDESDIRTYLSAVLMDQGFETVAIDETQAVVPAVRQSAPELIIMDIMMPLRSGISIFKELRQQPDLAVIPVILISGYSGREDFMANEFRRLVPEREITAPEGFVEKPLDLEMLMNTIETVLETKGVAQ
jgi:CheY-like chemotaxis protein